MEKKNPWDLRNRSFATLNNIKTIFQAIKEDAIADSEHYFHCDNNKGKNEITYIEKHIYIVNSQ